MRRFSARRGGWVVTGDTALHAFDRLAITKLGNSAAGYFALTGQLVDGEADLFNGKLGRCRDLCIEQLAMFFQVLEDHIRSHVESLSRDGKLYFLNEFRFQLHGTNAINFAVDIMISLNEADVLDLGANLDDQG